MPSSPTVSPLSLHDALPIFQQFFDMALERRWVEWEPRASKQPGAYCTSSKLSGESRVFMTYQGSLGDVSTLAHEMGHAFHNHIRSEEHTSELQSPCNLVCRHHPPSPLFPYTTLFRSSNSSSTWRSNDAGWSGNLGPASSRVRIVRAPS